jgi:cysteine desulfurase
LALHGHAQWLVSAIEHSSVLKNNPKAVQIPVTPQGVVDLSALDKLLSEKKPTLVSVMLANNETGVIQPIAEVAALCKQYGAKLHCDAVQALGKIPVDAGMLGCDMMSISAHKCGGPVGAAALIVRRGTDIKPLLVGGGQEKGRRAGTENIAAIVGFAKAVELFDFAQMKKIRGWLDEMEKETAVSIGAKSPRLPNTSCIAMQGVSNEVQLMDFDLKGFAVSAGSACSSGRIEPSHVLAAMHVPKEQAACAIRVSAGWNTAEQDIAAFTQAWQQTAQRLRKSA